MTEDSEYGDYDIFCKYILNESVEFQLEIIDGKEKEFAPEKKAIEIAQFITVQ